MDRGRSGEAAFDRRLAQRFYGVDDDHQTQDYGLWRIGAHPLRAVVSGALLYLSPGAILDLPPFSNLNFKVMWVDDHLKFLLHRTLGHFAKLPEDPWKGRRPEVDKERPFSQPVRDYTFGDYIPTVFWGSLLEAWIQKNPLVKLSQAEIEHLLEPGTQPPIGDPGPLARSLRSAMRKGHLDMPERGKLYRDLQQAALERIERIRDEWSMLRTSKGQPSTACAWVQGGSRRCTGLAAGLLVDDGRSLSRDIREGIDRLILQAMSYIDWTLNWPNVVQTIRSIPPGKFISDLEADPVTTP